jgi:SDR family mycofactocin-dependent oxidoreductase
VTLAERGAEIIAVDICETLSTTPYAGATKEDLEETARLVEQLDRRIVTRQVDVRNAEGMKAAVAEGVAELGRLDIVSANAAICSYADATAVPQDTWIECIDINLNGVWNTVDASLPHLRAGGRGGSIVLTSSSAGLKGFRGAVHYVTAKHGVVGMMKALAIELAPYNIRVNTVNPTQTRTPMIMNEATMRVFVPGSESPTMAEFAAASTSMNLLEIPWVEPRDISNAIAFLASDDARYITGVALPVDAGSVVR